MKNSIIPFLYGVSFCMIVLSFIFGCEEHKWKNAYSPNMTDAEAYAQRDLLYNYNKLNKK